MRAATPDCSTSDTGETQPVSSEDPPLSQSLIEHLYHDTTAYWLSWLKRCTYKGRWREVVQRAALALKLLTFAPTGAIVAAATFSVRLALVLCSLRGKLERMGPEADPLAHALPLLLALLLLLLSLLDDSPLADPRGPQRRRQELGLPLRVDPRRVVHGLRPPAPRLH